MGKPFYALLTIIILLGVLLFRPVLVVSVYYPHGGEYLLQQVVEPGTVLATEIIHSVEKTPVIEEYEVRGEGGFLLTRTIIMSQGYGMPSTFSHDLELIDGRFHISGIDTPIDLLPLRFCHINNPQLSVGQTVIPLAQLVDDGKLVEVTARKTPYAKFWLGRVVDNAL